MKKLTIALLASIVLLFNSCEVVEILTEAEGTVLNGMADGDKENYWEETSDNSLEGAQIKLYKRKADGTYPADTAEPTAKATVNSRGEYTTDSGISDGWFKVTGKHDGWVFVPKYVLINGDFSTIPPLVAFPDQGNNTLVFVLSWEDTDLDLDGIMTYYDGSSRDYVGVLFDNASAYPNEEKIRTAGFDKDGYNYNYTTNANTQPILLERDVKASTPDDLPRVETIIVKFDSNAAYTGATGVTTSVAGGDVDQDQLKYYVNAFNTTNGLSGEDITSPNYSSYVPFSDAQVDVMYGKYHAGGWKLPFNTAEKTLNVVNVTVTGDQFVVYSGNGSNYNPVLEQDIIRSVDTGVVSVDVIK